MWHWTHRGVDLFYDIGEEVCMKVIVVNFKTQKENINSVDDAMEILCSFNQEGLGLMKWW